jgi:CheY-like chemotaxis protein
MAIKVLYLEDEKNMVEYLPLLLQMKGIEIKSTSSISEVLDLLKNNEYDVVLLDIMMPPLDDMNQEELEYGRLTGMEVARRMKRIKPSIPIIGFTALTDEEKRKKMRGIGINHFITRPAELDNIISMIRQVSKSGD